MKNVNRTFGELVRELRNDRGIPLRELAAFLQIDQAIMSKIETGKRRASRELISPIAEFLKVEMDELHLAWLSDKVLYELGQDPLAEEALKVAEQRMAYRRRLKTGLDQVRQALKDYFITDERVGKAWLFGSVVRNEADAGSDVDVLIEESGDVKFNYFDLGDIQAKLEKLLGRKVDLGMANSLNERVAKRVWKEAELIYER